MSCVAGRCTFACPTIVDAGSDIAFVSNADGGPHCGDGVVNGTEECDDGTRNAASIDLSVAYGKCMSNCQRGGFCGDGVVQTEHGEECDDGILDGSYGGCTPQCKLGPYCGDGIVNGPEELQQVRRLNTLACGRIGLDVRGECRLHEAIEIDVKACRTLCSIRHLHVRIRHHRLSVAIRQVKSGLCL